jgi:NAD+ synthase
MRVVQEKIINVLHVLPSINPELEVRTRIDFVKTYLLKSGAKKIVLGISGGQDSTLVGKLCQVAIQELRNETKNNEYTFVAVRLPYGVQKDEDDAQMALGFIHPDEVLVFNIKSSTDAFAVEFATSTKQSITDYNKGNVKARMRMLAQYAIGALSQSVGGLVAGTDHAAEAVTGFFTKYGDGAVDFTPITGLNKRQGKALLKYLDAPEKLYLKVPTADLLDQNSGQPDETELGISYDQLDDFLEGKDVGDEIATKIEDRYQMTEHKRNQPVSLYDI